MADNRDIHKGHRQRLRERAFSEGLDAFNPHQVLELLLFYAIPRQDVSALAHALIKRFGTVRSVLTAKPSELMEVSGVGRRTAEWLTRMGEACEAYLAMGSCERPKISNFRDALRFCEEKRAEIRIPQTCQMCLTPSGTIQLFSKISDSLAWGAPQTLREALEHVLSVHARNVIIVEFTCAEILRVDEQECLWAEQYAHVLRVMGAELLDVVLVGNRQIMSMNKEKYYDRSSLGAAKSVLSERYLRETERPLEGAALPEGDEGL